MAPRAAGKPYAKPVVRKHSRLTDVTESPAVITSGVTVKGGCFSKKR
jgi:hypothetical protein